LMDSNSILDPQDWAALAQFFLRNFPQFLFGKSPRTWEWNIS